MSELQDVLNRGNGIALICLEIECPHCSSNIWVDIGHHCGFDALIDSDIRSFCYECLTPIKNHMEDVKILQQDFMTISEHTNITYKL